MIAALERDLEVGRDAVYRRMRGDTALTAAEYVHLTDRYAVNGTPRSATPQERTLPILHYPAGLTSYTDEVSYMRDLRNATNEIVNLPGVTIDYATPELSLFYELSPPLLRKFKLFIYSIMTWNVPKMRNARFSPRLIDPEVDPYIDAIIGDAYNIPGREIWSIGILDITLRQISYVVEVGRMEESSLVDRLFEELYGIVDHLERMAQAGRRFPQGQEARQDSPAFVVYHNELSNTNNNILVKSSQGRILFSTLINPNYITTTDDVVCDDVQNWFESMMSKSNILNSSSAKYSTIYFNTLRQQLDNRRNALKTGIDVF